MTATPNGSFAASVSGGRNVFSDHAGRSAGTGNVPARTRAPPQIQGLDRTPPRSSTGTSSGCAPDGVQTGCAPGHLNIGWSPRHGLEAAGRADHVGYPGTSHPRAGAYYLPFALSEPEASCCWLAVREEIWTTGETGPRRPVARRTDYRFASLN